MASYNSIRSSPAADPDGGPPSQGNTDQLVGTAMATAAAVVFSYYTLWALVTPFFPADSAVQAYFPDREWAVRIPAALLVVAMAGVGALTGMVLLKQARKEKEKRSLKGA